jgi:site-specific recombinase XerD
MNNITIPTKEKQLNRHASNAELVVTAYLSQMATRRGRDVQKQALDFMADILSGGRVSNCLLFPWHFVRYEHAQAVRARLIETYKPATVNRFISALRGVLRAAWRVGLMSAENYARATDLKCVKGSSLPAGREVSEKELQAIFTACATDKSCAGVRDFALLSVMYGGGLRRDELSTLTLSDIEMDPGRVLVHGKGSKERYAYLPDGALSALRAWVIVRGDRAGALFVRIRKSDRMCEPEKHMTGQAIYTILIRRAAAAGVCDVSPHDMRRTFVSNLLDNGQDLSTVSKMAGHSSVQTTVRYDRRNDEAKKRAALTLTIPWMV